LDYEGKTDEATADFKKMCVLDGLSRLLTASSVDAHVVDDLVYDLGHGAPNTDLFAGRMIERLQQA